MLTGRSGGHCGKVISPKREVILSVVQVHVAKLGDVQVAEIVLVKLVPGDVASPVRSRHSAAQNIIMTPKYNLLVVALQNLTLPSHVT